MRTIYLRAQDKEALLAALVNAGLASVQEEEGDTVITEGYTLDLIGVIHTGTGQFQTDDEGNEYEITEPLPGYHANLRGEVSPEQEDVLPVIPEPNNPVRKFF